MREKVYLLIERGTLNGQLKSTVLKRVQIRLLIIITEGEGVFIN